MDHVNNYRPPKDHGDEDEVTKKLRMTGVAPQAPSSESEEEEDDDLLPAPSDLKKGE